MEAEHFITTLPSSAIILYAELYKSINTFSKSRRKQVGQIYPVWLSVMLCKQDLDTKIGILLLLMICKWRKRLHIFIFPNLWPQVVVDLYIYICEYLWYVDVFLKKAQITGAVYICTLYQKWQVSVCSFPQVGVICITSKSQNLRKRSNFQLHPLRKSSY